MIFPAQKNYAHVAIQVQAFQTFRRKSKKEKLRLFYSRNKKLKAVTDSECESNGRKQFLVYC